MDRCFGASSALLVFWQLASFEPIAMAELSCTTYLPYYLYPPTEFQWNPGQYLPMCEVCPQVQDKNPAFLRANEAEVLLR